MRGEFKRFAPPKHRETKSSAVKRDWSVPKAADAEEICDAALNLVEQSSTFDQLPFELDWEVLLQDKVILQPALGKTNVTTDTMGSPQGDVDAGMKQADVITNFSLRREENVVITVENTCVLSDWEGDQLHVWIKTQNVASSSFRSLASEAKMHYYNTFQGAQFLGASTNMAGPMGACGAALAKKLRRPVMALFDPSHFYSHDWNLGTYTFKVGYKKDGTITAVDGDLLQGRALGWGNTDMQKQSKIVNLRWHERKSSRTSRGPDFCHRDGGDLAGIQGTAPILKVADELGMDPTVVAKINEGCAGRSWDQWAAFRQAHWPGVNRHSFDEGLAMAKKMMDWDKKWHAAGKNNVLPNGRLHGMTFNYSNEWAQAHRYGWVQLYIAGDGTVKIIGHHADVGPGCETAYCQVVADELGVTYDQVEQRGFSKDVGYEIQHPGGSTNTVAMTPSLSRAARKAKRMLLERATTQQYADPAKDFREVAPIPTPQPGGTANANAGTAAAFAGKKPEELDVKDGYVFEIAAPDNKKTVASICSSATGQEPVIVDDYTGPMDGRYSACLQFHMLEVEVDPDTGMVYPTKVVCVNDVGMAINPDQVNAQQYGGAYMGIGSSLFEEVYYDTLTGQKLNDNLVGYPITLMNDIGPIDCGIVETGMGYGAYGVVGIGENIGANTYNLTWGAVQNAIGKFLPVMPSTPDRVLQALGKA